MVGRKFTRKRLRRCYQKKVGLDLDRRWFGGGCCSLEPLGACFGAYFFASFEAFGWLMAERAIFLFV